MYVWDVTEMKANLLKMNADLVKDKNCDDIRNVVWSYAVTE